MTIKNLDDIVREATPEGLPPRVAIARSANSFVLEAAINAYEAGLAEPVFIGDICRTREVAREMGIDISPFPAVDIADDEGAVNEAVRLFREGEVSVIMKGLVPTATLLRAVLNKETGVPPEGLLSHVAVFNHPHGEDRLLLMTDPAINIHPNLQRKEEIVRNALKVADVLGMERPRVALLAATEKVNYPAMPATLDADLLAKMGAQGQFGDARLAGPMALDVAISPQAAACKSLGGDVAGQADVLLAPDIESGNVLYKCVNTLLGVPVAGVVVGSRVPVVLPSRGDSAQNKFYSLALATYYARRTGAESLGGRQA